jgi:hypothetical protein
MSTSAEPVRQLILTFSSNLTPQSFVVSIEFQRFTIGWHRRHRNRGMLSRVIYAVGLADLTVPVA